MAIKISACVIVKNEEKNMPRWLECMKNVADEMIVVDTGSTDNTVAIAKEAGANLYHFKWINDFAAAKNYAIEQATGDWILFLDADETFTPEAQKILRQEMERFNRDKSVACLLNRVIDIDVDNNNRIFNNSLIPRIFRRSPNIRYTGAVHEQVENRKGDKKAVFASNLEILHTGYSSSICRLKSERNLPILLQELEKADTTEKLKRVYPYLMDAYSVLEDHDKVLYYAQKCIDIDCRMVGKPAHFYEVMTLSMFNAGRPSEEVLAKLDEATEKFPDAPFFYFVRAMALEAIEDYTGSELAVLRGFELREIVERNIKHGMGNSDTSVVFVPYSYERLGNIYSLKGDKQRAADNYLKALQSHKYQTDSLRGLCHILAGTDDVELIGLLNSIYSREDGSFILNTLKGEASAGVLSYYGKNAQGVEQGYIYMANNRFDSGGVKFGERYRELIQAGLLASTNMANPPQDGYLTALVSDGYRALFDKNTKEAASLRRLKEYRIRVGLDDI